MVKMKKNVLRSNTFTKSQIHKQIIQSNVDGKLLKIMKQGSHVKFLISIAVNKFNTYMYDIGHHAGIETPRTLATVVSR